jgi:hypothetical protein
LHVCRCRTGAQRINGTRFQLNDGTALPNFPNSVANSTLAYTHWNFFHWNASRWVPNGAAEGRPSRACTYSTRSFNSCREELDATSPARIYNRRRWNDTTSNCVSANPYRFDHYAGSLTNLTQLSNETLYNKPLGNYDKWGAWFASPCNTSVLGVCEFSSSFFECR